MTNLEYVISLQDEGVYTPDEIKQKVKERKIEKDSDKTNQDKIVKLLRVQRVQLQQRNQQ